jgi:hypothetical protein
MAREGRPRAILRAIGDEAAEKSVDHGQAIRRRGVVPRPAHLKWSWRLAAVPPDAQARCKQDVVQSAEL